MKDITDFIQTVGFPIFVAVYVLLRLEKAVKELTEVFRDLQVTLLKCPLVEEQERLKKGLDKK